MRIVVHTLDHNEQYQYLRDLIYTKCQALHDIYFLVQKEGKASGGQKKEPRFRIEQRLFRLARKRKELFSYFLNRFLLIFFKKHKKRYDRKKLFEIDLYFKEKRKSLLSSPRVHFITNINKEANWIKEISPDLLIVVGAPYIRSDILKLVPQRLNLHIGYLPDYRGLKTIEWAYLRGDYQKLGYTLHELTEKLDHGKVYAQETYRITPGERINFGKIYTTLYEKAFDKIVDIMRDPELLSQGKQMEGEGHLYNGYLFNPFAYKKLLKAEQVMRLGFFAGNPVQYHVPLYQRLHQASGIDLFVLYGEDIGAKRFYNQEFQAYIEWGCPLARGLSLSYFLRILHRVNPKVFFRGLIWEWFFIFCGSLMMLC